MQVGVKTIVTPFWLLNKKCPNVGSQHFAMSPGCAMFKWLFHLMVYSNPPFRGLGEIYLRRPDFHRSKNHVAIHVISHLSPLGLEEKRYCSIGASTNVGASRMAGVTAANDYKFRWQPAAPFIVAQVKPWKVEDAICSTFTFVKAFYARTHLFSETA